MVENEYEEGLVVGIDASRNRSGGAKAHLIGILAESEPKEYGIKQIHVWSYKSLLDAIPDQTWLVKHSPAELEGSLLRQLWWQRFTFPGELEQAGCDIVLNTDAGTISNCRPAITMSRDMLSYEPGEIERFGFSKARLRLILLRYAQNRSLRQADGTIFLTQYASKIIQRSCGMLSRIAHIPHGVGVNFKDIQPIRTWPKENERAIECLYVSNAALYKHQWIVVRAMAELRRRGFNIQLTLVGGGSGRAQRLLDAQIASSDPSHTFVRQMPFVPQNELPNYLANTDIFVFASSCENMPNTLVEAMSVGLPIACSDRGPMPEVLIDGGVYFNPEDVDSVVQAVEEIINDPELRCNIGRRAKVLSEQYSWSRCGQETWNFIVDTHKSITA